MAHQNNALSQLGGFLIVTDRGGHWHNAEMLVANMGILPQWIVTTYGPDISVLKSKYPDTQILWVPYLFTWWGQKRIFNPAIAVWHVLVSFYLAWRIRPKTVLSLGATNVVVFCYFAKWFKSKIIHVECMNQVNNPSATGKCLYRISDKFFVQWPELLAAYGDKAEYAGWVL